MNATKVRERLLESIRREPSPTRSDLARREMWLVVVGVAIAVSILLAMGGPNAGQRSSSEVVISASAWMACAIIVTWIALARLRHGMGISRDWRTLAAVVTTPILIATFVVVCRDEMNRGAAATVIATLKCLAATLAMATAPLVVLLIARRGSDATHPRATGAAIGAAAGAWGGVLIDLHCPTAAFPHVALGHALPALVLAAVGALVGKSALGISSRR
jgi:hypothetical protein